MNKKIIFSGVQPSGNFHLGNYLGALKSWVELQEKYNSIFCIVDLHAITVPENSQYLREKPLEIAKIYQAAGIDIKRSTIFVQSHIKEHAELMWLLNSITKTGDLFKMTQFKDKTSGNREKESVEAGLLNYPILMAADILLYDTDLVPVGEDQIQHVEFTRKLAKKFNRYYGETFKIPEAYTKKETTRIMSLTDPSKKMSKSSPSENSRIEILENPEKAKEKIKKAVTDSGSSIEYSDAKPALKNLINIYSAIGGLSVEEVEKQYSGKGYKELKEDLGDLMAAFLKEFQEKYSSISDEEVLELLDKNAKKLRREAEAKIKEVKQNMGFLVI
ncbi:MAG: tryptophan--tRNA ligase [Candidatus Moranbacteria bacterium]|nr:tryptophan--tRNA ligase [Candidatus Moranbacteria bacterium]